MRGAESAKAMFRAKISSGQCIRKNNRLEAPKQPQMGHDAFMNQLSEKIYTS